MAQLSDVITRLQSLTSAIENALEHEVWDATYNSLLEKAQDNVYSFPASDFFMRTRRGANGGLIDPDNYERSVSTAGSETVLTIKNTTPLQNLWSNTHKEPLTPVVESGDERYFQPYPRPFMEEGRDSVMNGAAELALAQGLIRQGYDVTVI